ncbi:MAG: RNA polymerase sigma factor [Chloroflexota bacterium]|nr:RNA polymerase sigma factor [Chloroflexota bacterium]
MREEAGAELIAHAKGDRAAFGEIYDLYLNRVYAFCLGHTASREEAEDVTAQTFERALTALPRYEDRGAPLSSWLLRIAANAAVDRARSAKRVTTLSGPAVDDNDQAPEEDAVRSEEPGPAELAEQWEQAQSMRERLAALPTDQQRAVRLRYYEDRALLDIAAEMGRSEGAVKQLLQRALKGLRTQMQQEAAFNV